MNRRIVSISFLLSTCVFLILSCGHNDPHEGSAEIAISRALERAIVIGEKYISERELIENVAITEGTYAASLLSDEIRHRDNYEAFWEYLKEADSLFGQVSDSLRRQRIVSDLMPYVDRLITLSDEIMP